jgi:hypothetical protein
MYENANIVRLFGQYPIFNSTNPLLFLRNYIFQVLYHFQLLPLHTNTTALLTMAGLFLSAGALLGDRFKERRSKKHNDYDFEAMKAENARLYARIQHSQAQDATPQALFDTDHPSNPPPSYGKLSDRGGGFVATGPDASKSSTQIHPSDRVATRDMAVAR